MGNPGVNEVALVWTILRGSLVLFTLLTFSLTFTLPAAAADPGDLDVTFGAGGKVTTDFGGNDVGQSVAVTSSGKIVVGGVAYSSPGTGDFALMEYNTNGSPDTSFGPAGTGMVTTTFGTGVATVWSVAIYGDSSVSNAGKILAAGDTTANGPNDFALARYYGASPTPPPGTLDPSFGAGGKVTTNFAGSSSDQIFSVAIQSDNRIVVAGASNPNAPGGTWDFALARYLDGGALDTSFGTAGMVLTDFAGGTDAATSVAIQSDGKIVAVGYSANNFALARYLDNGTLDTSFGIAGTGMVTTNFGGNDYGYSVAIQSDGKIVVAGYSNASGGNDFALARYNTDGTLDTTTDSTPATSFGTANTGMVTTNLGGSQEGGRSVIIWGDGKIVVAGYSNASGGNDFALAQYSTNGSLDPNFGATNFGTFGWVTTDFGGSSDLGYSVASWGGTKIVVAGSGASGDFAVARYWPVAVSSTPLPGVGWPGLLVLALGFAALGSLTVIRRARAGRAG